MQAINNIKTVLQIVPDWLDAWYAAGVTYEAAGDLKNAEACYNRLVELDPKNIDNLLVKASFLADQHRIDEAKSVIKIILEQTPSDAVLTEVEAIEKKLK